jgi:hypothetical protein
MGDPAKRGATYEDLVAVPRHLVAEIIHGVLIKPAAWKTADGCCSAPGGRTPRCASNHSTP